jgi:hypothetical protein
VLGGWLLLPPQAIPNGTTAAAPSATSDHVLILRFSVIGKVSWGQWAGVESGGAHHIAASTDERDRDCTQFDGRRDGEFCRCSGSGAAPGLSFGAPTPKGSFGHDRFSVWLSLRYCLTKLREKAVFCVQPIWAKCHPWTSFSTHLATDGSSPEADTDWGLPSGPIVIATLVLTDCFVDGFRSQHVRWSAD